MEMHQLRYVLAVARTGNFSRAAEQCHVSQPALSQQVQKLEDELGERLFDRLKREVRLTPQGEAFLPRASRILAEVDAAKREAGEARELLRGSVTVGVLPTIAPYLLPGVISQFGKTYPGVDIVVQEDTTAQLLKLTLAYDVDLALVSLPISDERLELRNLFSEELVLAVPPKHRLARKTAVAVNDLAEERFIVMKEGHCLGDQVLQFCERSGARSRISFRSAQLETIQALVASGLGLSLVPAMAARVLRRNAPAYRSFRAPAPHRTIVAIWPKQRPLSRAAKAFFTTLSSQLPEPR